MVFTLITRRLIIFLVVTVLLVVYMCFLGMLSTKYGLALLYFYAPFILLIGFNLGRHYSYVIFGSFSFFSILALFKSPDVAGIVFCQIILFLTASLVPQRFNYIKKVRKAIYARRFFPMSNSYKEMREKNIVLDEKIQNYHNEIESIATLYEISKKMGASLDLQSMIETISEGINRTLHLDDFVIFTYDGESKKFAMETKYNISDEIVETLLKILDYNKWMYVERNPIYIRDRNSDYRFLHEAQGREFGKRRTMPRTDLSALRSILSIPLVIKNEILGIIISIDEKPDAFSEEILTNGTILANQVAIGFHKAELYEKIQEMSRVDGLTKLYLPRVFYEKLNDEFLRSKRYNTPFSLLMIDLDFFKKYNDTYGHPAGDEILRHFASLIRDNVYDTDVVSRYGGEEFAIIMPMTKSRDSGEKAERIRALIENYPFYAGKDKIKITASIGVSSYPQDTKSLKNLVKYADEALYWVKRHNRNKVKEYGQIKRKK